MNPTTLRTVAAKIQAAPVGSRELDAECALALGYSVDKFGPEYDMEKLPKSGAFISVILPNWTTSFDAHRALAEEKVPHLLCASGSAFSASGRSGFCRLRDKIQIVTETKAATESLASVAAILLALAAKIEGEAK